MSKVIRLTDRSRTVSDWKCPRARYYGYEWEGTGLASGGTNLALFTGTVLHDALAAIATYTRDGVEIPIDTIANLAYQQMYEVLAPRDGEVVLAESIEFAKEQATLTEGLIRGFHRHAWPLLMANTSKIVAIEQEMEYTLLDTESEGYVFMAKPDLIIEDLNGDLVYLEYKSTSSKKENWINSWDTAVQLHSSIRATEQTLDRAPSYVQIVGLYKGYESYGKQSSPFCYAYMKKGNPPFTEDQISYEYKPGFKRYATWEMRGGVKEWIASMPETVLTNQFPMTMPILVNDELVDNFFEQLLAREREISLYHNPKEGYELTLGTTFPQRFDQCQPQFGFPCSFKKLCHSGVVDPLNEGYVKRVPHHAKELEAQNA